jgi:hypothetical protein
MTCNLQVLALGALAAPASQSGRLFKSVARRLGVDQGAPGEAAVNTSADRRF